MIPAPTSTFNIGSVLTREVILKQIMEGKLTIDPFSEDLVRENGIDLRLDRVYALPVETVRRFGLGHIKTFNLHVEVRNKVDELCRIEHVFADTLTNEVIEKLYVILEVSDYIVIPPRSFALLVTKEYVKLPDDLVGFCNLRSTLARLGLMIPPTIVDAGFEGQLVIEVYNTRDLFIYLRPNTPFLHLVLARTEGKATYSGSYQRQIGVRLPDPTKLRPRT